MTSYVKVGLAGGQVVAVAVKSNGTVSIDTLKSVTSGAVNLVTVVAGENKVMGAIRDGGVEPPPGGWTANTVYEVVYVENDEKEVIVHNNQKNVIKMKVMEVLKKDPETANAIVVWADGKLEEMDFLATPGLLEFIRDKSELRGAGLRGFLGTMQMVKKDKAELNDFVDGVAAASIYLSEVRPHSALPCLTLMALPQVDGLWPGCLFDSHCHLDLLPGGEGEDLEAQLDASLARDGQAVPLSCLGGVLANRCYPRGWPKPEQLGPGARVHISLGCHPKQADQLTPATLARLEGLARAGGVVAIGECGLDYSRGNRVGREVQAAAFLAQLELALRLHLPLVLHAREAEEDCYRLLRAAGVPPHWPIHNHCFNNSWAAASRWLAAFPASKIGLTALVTFPSAGRVQEVARRAPLSRILLETDAPYFRPQGPLVLMEPGARLVRAEPGHVLQVAAAVARLKGCSIQKVLGANLRNVTEIYGIKTDYSRK